MVMAKRKPIPIEMLTPEFMGDFAKVITESDKSPFACVSIVTAVLENVLMTLLHTAFIKGETTDRLFASNGPLESLFKCSQMAYCLGFISTPMFENRDKIGQIHNAFAHARKIPDWDTKQIKD